MIGYGQLCTEFYDIDKPSAPEDALELYLSYAREASGPILEPMCGSGRFLVPLLERKFDIDGTDTSPSMLQACRAKCRRLGLRPVLYEQALHQADLPRQYGLVIIPAGSFCLVVEPDQARESLIRLHASMLSGAKLVLEIERLIPRKSSTGPWGGRWVERPDGAKILLSWLDSYDEEKQVTRSVNRYELIKDGQLLQTEYEDFNLIYYDPGGFSDTLQASGFGKIKMWRAYGFEPPAEADESIVFECSRP